MPKITLFLSIFGLLLCLSRQPASAVVPQPLELDDGGLVLASEYERQQHNAAGRELELNNFPGPDTPLPEDSARLKAISTKYLAEMAAFDPSQIDSLCLTPFVLASTGIFFIAPRYFYFFIDAGMSDVDSCSMMYFNFSMIGLYNGLAAWIDYRSCVIENSEDPDPLILDRLAEDRDYLIRTGIVFSIGAVFFGRNCDMPIWPTY